MSARVRARVQARVTCIRAVQNGVGDVTALRAYVRVLCVCVCVCVCAIFIFISPIGSNDVTYTFKGRR